MRDPRGPDTTNKLFVYNLSPNNKNEARAYFKRFGKVLTIKAVRKGHAGLPFGFVTFKEASSLRVARQQSKHELSSSTLICLQAKSRQRMSELHKSPIIASTASRRTRRRIGYIQRHPPAAPGPCVLADVVREAPILLDFLPRESWSALSATSSTLRHLVHSFTTIVSIDNSTELQALGRCSWPQLGLVLVRKDQWLFHFRDAVKGNIQLLSACSLSTGGYESTAVLIVRPKSRRQQTHFARQKMLSTAALNYLNSPQWKQLQNLRLCQCHLSAKGLGQLAGIDWPNLHTLRLHSNNLECAGITQLAKGVWPQLRELDLSHNDLDAAAVAQLVQGAWPRLQRLDLSNNHLLDAAAFKLLSRADWPRLAHLGLNYTKLDAASIGELAQIHWADLTTLEFQHTAVDSEAIAALASAKWPMLRSLDLSGNGLGAEAMAQLVLASFPCLQSLRLAHNKLNAAAAKQLARGDWPLLSVLDLSDNYLDEAAAFHLSRGDWPRLQELEVQYNSITVLGLECLTHSNWDALEDLYLDLRAISARTWALLSLEANSMPAASLDPMLDITALRQVSEAAQTGQAILWPRMTRVRFFSCMFSLRNGHSKMMKAARMGMADSGTPV